jgi:uncharacterized protein YndB with AHSA1/START domain
MSTTTQKTQVTVPGEREVRMERIFDAPRERVWRALTEPELVAQWWGRGNRLEIERDEVYAGGHWRYIEHAGDETHGFEGRYREVTPPERVVRTFDWDGMPGYPVIETAELLDLGDGRTKLVATALFFTREERDGMMQAGMTDGASQSYDALERLLATVA